MRLSTLQIAEVCYNNNQAYTFATIGLLCVPWSQLYSVARRVIIHEVEMYIANPELTPDTVHHRWVLSQKEDGWVYGKDYNTHLRTNPLMVDFNNIPQGLITRGWQFKALVNTLA